MINTKTYSSKSNTIIKNSPLNLGLNPVMELSYGDGNLSRCLIYFDHNKIKKMVEDKIYPDINKLKHILHITNAASITSKKINCGMFASNNFEHHKERAISFDLIFFLIPNEWDNGRGYMYYEDLYNGAHSGVSTRGTNWFQYRDYFKWEEDGIYSTERMVKEMELFTNKNGNMSPVIFGYQHFDYGNEDIELDVTCIFNKFITEELSNYGIGIAFAPSYELTETKIPQYVGFFTHYTHSIYEPYIETTYDEIIEDDRSNFYLDKDNKLYFYASVGGNYVNLDVPPTCSLNGVQMTSKQATRGIYYIDINLSSDDYEDNVMMYDTWTNIIYKGKQIKDIELSFVTKSQDNYFSFGLPSIETAKPNFIPSLYGINQKEQIQQGDIRKINIDCKIPYTSNQLFAVDGIEYRVYTKEGEAQYTIIDWSKVERGYNENYFLLNTNDFIPFRYYIDIRIHNNYEVINHYEMLTFDIVNDMTETYK